MSNDGTGQETELRIASRGRNEQKVNGSCFCILFASGAEAGTWIADDNGFP